MREEQLPQAISTRQAFGQAILTLGAINRKIAVIDGDISRSMYTVEFSKRFPDRHLNMGIAEQNQMGVAAGLALTGYMPIVSSYAVFASMRALEQLRTSICYPRLNVKIAASHGGITPGNDGATHQATEDMGILRTLPNLTIIAPADGLSCEKLLIQACQMEGPVYLRLTRDPVKSIYPQEQEIVLGQAITVREGSDATIIAIGDMVQWALAAHELLSQEGISTRVIDMHTLKPLDQETVLLAAKETAGIVTAEDHSIYGGLGSAVAEVVGENYPVPIKRIGLPDVFGESGPYEHLLIKYNMATEDICAAVRTVVRRKRELSESA